MEETSDALLLVHGRSPPQPGLGELTGARVLAEIGDDRARFSDARALKA